VAETDALRRLEDKVDALTGAVLEVKGAMLARLDQHQITLDDHEKRIRLLERFRYSWPSLAGIAGLITALAELGVLVYYLAHH
jgi:hypothetical protein